jgi:uncharacterized protein YutE (UPF0331/DUF86 family)
MVYRKETILRRIEKLKEYKHDIAPFAEMSLEIFLQSKKDRYAAERVLFLLAECIIDILDHILAAKHGVASESYEEVISNSFEYAILDADLYDKLKGLGGFRNMLAHGYLIIADSETYANLLKMATILDEIIAHFERIV